MAATRQQVVPTLDARLQAQAERLEQQEEVIQALCLVALGASGSYNDRIREILEKHVEYCRWKQTI